MIAFYLVQPWILKFALLHSSLSVRALGFVGFCASMAYLAVELKHRLGIYYKFQVNLIWWLYGLQFSKHVHALVAPESLINTVGLRNENNANDKDNKDKRRVAALSWSRLCVLCYCPPTVIFQRPEVTQNSSPPRQVFPYKSATHYSLRGVAQMATMLQIAYGVLHFQLYNYLPLPMQSLLCFYMVCLSQGGFADLFMNAPTRLWIDNNHPTTNTDKLALVEPSDAPICTTHARYFWARWSKNVGTLHFRCALYQTLGGGYKHQYRATALTFGVNCVLHIFFWGPLSTRETKWAWTYLHVLVLAPAVALLLDKQVFQPLLLTRKVKEGKDDDDKKQISATSVNIFLYRACNWITLQVLAAILFPSFLDAQGMPTNLQELALLQTGQLG